MKLPVLTSTQNGAAHAPPDPRSAEEIVSWALRRFRPSRVAITTSFGLEGCALVDMVARLGRRLRVVYLDTHFLFTETHTLRRRLERRYPNLRFVNAGTSLTPAQQERLHGPRLWTRDPDLCCRLRKVEPMRAVLRRADAWITGIRREQSPTRSHVRTVQWDWQFDVLKVCPFAHWSRADVWTYVRASGVPYNELYEQGYPSIGCTHCTTRVNGATLDADTREGRWQGHPKTECGLHAGEEMTS